MIADLATATPVAVDTELAALHHADDTNEQRLKYAYDRLHSTAKTRIYHPATWGRKAYHEYTMTNDEVLAAVTEAYTTAKAEGDYDGPMSGYDLLYGGTEKVLAAIPQHKAERARLNTEINRLGAEYARRPWSRFFLVTSSDGHIHSSMSCQTCRPTTTYGWLPEMSGLTEQAAMDALTTLGPGPTALCSVCFPNAPVADDGKRTKVTKAKAAKLAA